MTWKNIRERIDESLYGEWVLWVAVGLFVFGIVCWGLGSQVCK